MLHKTQSVEEKSEHQVFTVEHDGDVYRTVFPSVLSDLSCEYEFERDAWANLVLNRLQSDRGDEWPIEQPMKCAKSLWSLLGDTPVNDNEELDESFLTFEEYTSIYDVWHWFESYFDVSVAEDLQWVARKYTDIENHLMSLGFTEMFGIGLWAKDSFGTAVDTNAGTAKVVPHIDASYDNFVGFAETPEKLDELIHHSDTSEFFTDCRAEYKERILSQPD